MRVRAGILSASIHLPISQVKITVKLAATADAHPGQGSSLGANYSNGNQAVILLSWTFF